MDFMLLALILLVAVYYDSRQNRIPNRLCGLGILVGIIYVLLCVIPGDWIQYIGWSLGLFVCAFPLWMLKAVGGGDVKLLAVVGLFLGKRSLSFIICAGLCMGTHALLLMIRRRNSLRRMTIFVSYFIDCMFQKKVKAYPFDKRKDVSEGGIRLSYGFLAGHLLAILTGMY